MFNIYVVATSIKIQSFYKKMFSLTKQLMLGLRFPAKMGLTLAPIVLPAAWLAEQATAVVGAPLAWGGFGLGLMLSIYLGRCFHLSVLGGVKTLRRHMINIAMGELRNDIQAKGKDEFTRLLHELNNMQIGLRETVVLVQSSSSEVVDSSVEIAAGAQDLSTRVESAATAIEELAASLDESSSVTAHTAESVAKASELALNNAVVAQRGGQVMADVVSTMEHIQTSSHKISDIIGVIDGIAFQTNILALNAAVEAARAGDQGRGFAVVAAEVRSLAQRSATAAREIKDLINASVGEINLGVEVVRGAGDEMQEIVSNADHVRQLMEEVARAAREQSQGIAQIGMAIQGLDQSTQANASLVEETAAAASSQQSAAIRMAAMVDEFRLPGQVSSGSKVEGLDVDAFIDAHRLWKVKLRDAIENRDKVDTDALKRDDCCALGKWIYGDGERRFGGAPSFVDLLSLHRNFHQVAGDVAEMINEQRFIDAEDALAPGTPFSDATRNVVHVLSAVKRIGF